MTPTDQFPFPISAGVTIYVAATDIMPEVNHEPGVKMALSGMTTHAMLHAQGYLVNP